jgi:hypothetical protein
MGSRSQPEGMKSGARHAWRAEDEDDRLGWGLKQGKVSGKHADPLFIDGVPGQVRTANLPLRRANSRLRTKGRRQ